MGQGKLYNIGFASSSKISGGTIIGTWQGNIITKPYISYAITGASDISWTTAFHNSGLKWDDGSKQWVAMASGGSPVTQLSAMTIDVDKDWQSKGIYNLSYISAATISGGSIKTDDLTIDANTISGLSVPLWPSSAVNKQYVDTRSNSGYAYVSSQGMIAHSLSSKPSYVNVMPSGFNVNFGVNCTVDDTNITVYLTIDGKRDVFWNAKI